jgi:hypothetical protein
VVAPWSAFWDHNRFMTSHAALEALVGSPWIRGAVSGIGVITVIAGLSELVTAILTRRREPAGPTRAEP